MIHFFGIMLGISIEPRNMGGYTSYFQGNHGVHMGGNYDVRLCWFDPLAKKIIPLIMCKQI